MLEDWGGRRQREAEGGGVAISQRNKIIECPPVIPFRTSSSCRKYVSKCLLSVWKWLKITFRLM